MYILLTIFLFLLIPLVMLILRLARPRFNIQGFLAVLAALAGWVFVFLARADLPTMISMLQWKPEVLFNLSPSLVVDDSSWYFSLALVSLSLSVIIISISQLGYTSQSVSDASIQPALPPEDQAQGEEQGSPAQPGSSMDTPAIPEWIQWISMLVLTSLGLLAVTAGNLLTLLLAWSSLDIVEILLLLGQMVGSRIRERIILAFSARMAAICVVLIAAVMLWSQGSSLGFDSMSSSAAVLLIVAAGLRLGVLPLHLPYTRRLPIARHLGTVLRLIPAAASFILLVRVAAVPFTSAILPYLLALSILAGLYGGVNWLRAKDELDGRPYWLLASSSLVVIAAILHQPAACLVLSLTGMLSGGLIFSMSLRRRSLIPLILLGVISLSGLPFSPAWQGTDIYQFSPSLGLNVTLFALFAILFLLIQASLLAGFLRHALRGIITPPEISTGLIERWVWFFYPLGLTLLVVTHMLVGILIFPGVGEVSLSGWLLGGVETLIAGAIFYITWRSPNIYSPAVEPKITSAWEGFFSLAWLYRLLWRVFRTLTRAIALISAMLEGDGGLLWALVLFGLIFVFLQR